MPINQPALKAIIKPARVQVPMTTSSRARTAGWGGGEGRHSPRGYGMSSQALVGFGSLSTLSIDAVTKALQSVLHPSRSLSAAAEALIATASPISTCAARFEPRQPRCEVHTF